LYIYVGNHGEKKANNCSYNPDAGWNGGGRTAYSCHGGAGGGATDISLYGTVDSAEWNNANHLYSRIIVAGGGGGLDYDYNTSLVCGVGGGLSGTVGTTKNNATAGSQTGPGTGGASQGGTAGFGYGGSDASNGGGGWYGGAADRDTTCGAGGSGYVYTSSTYNNYPAGCKLNSSFYLTDAQTIAGNKSIPLPAGGTETGHAGAGYARISLVQ
jgi:hypothetical protein